MAQVAREERMAAAAGAGAQSGDDEDGSSPALDALDVIEALCNRHEEPTAAVLSWSWKLFCARWARLYAWTAEERERQEARAVEREFARLRRS